MIHPTTHVKTRTGPLPGINRDLIKARHIQSHLKEMAADGLAPTGSYLCSSVNNGPGLVPITRWIG